MAVKAVVSTLSFLSMGDAASCTFGGVSNDRSFYKDNAAAFIGLNPREGYGSGFLLMKGAFRKSFGDAPGTNGDLNDDPETTTRQDLCTCDCKDSADGVGCVGWGGIAFRYISTLSAAGTTDEECGDQEWYGQMVAQQCTESNNKTLECAYDEAGQKLLSFIGEDRRASPGGRASYRVGAVYPIADDAFMGVFRQLNSPVSCKAGILDKINFLSGKKQAKSSCFAKCGGAGRYEAWLKWCNETIEDTTQGFSGFDEDTSTSIDGGDEAIAAALSVTGLAMLTSMTTLLF